MSEFDKPVLALDSALGGCVVAVLDGDRVFSRTLETSRDQAAKLMPMVQDVVAEAGIGFADLGLIVTTHGPGSFTGLRIGLSTARSLGLALGIPIQGVSTLAVVAQSCAPKQACLVVLESKRADFYTQSFDENANPVGEPVCLLSSQLPDDALLCGDGVARVRTETGRAYSDAVSCILPDPVLLARSGRDIFIKNGRKAQKPEPFYMRGADVSVSNKQQRQINDYPA